MIDETEYDEMVLVISSGDHGDEIDLEGFAIFKSPEHWEEYKNNIPDTEKECYYGSNEFVLFEDKADYMSHLHVANVPQETIKCLIKTLNLRFYDWRGYADYGLFITNQMD